MAYISKSLKELIIKLAAVIGMFDQLQKTGALIPEDADAAKLIIGSVTTICQHLLSGRDTEQAEAVARQAKFYEIVALPNTSAMVNKEYYLCPKEDFEALVIDDFNNPCPFCDKEGKAAKRCERRRALIRCGVAGETSGDCPYKGV